MSNKWTPEKIAELHQIVSEADSSKAGFAAAAKKFKIVEGSAMSKYYSTNPDGSKREVKKRKAVAKPDAAKVARAPKLFLVNIQVKGEKRELIVQEKDIREVKAAL